MTFVLLNCTTKYKFFTVMKFILSYEWKHEQPRHLLTLLVMAFCYKFESATKLLISGSSIPRKRNLFENLNFVKTQFQRCKQGTALQIHFQQNL